MFYIEHQITTDELAKQIVDNMDTYSNLVDLITTIDLMIGDSEFTDQLLEALNENN